MRIENNYILTGKPEKHLPKNNILRIKNNYRNISFSGRFDDDIDVFGLDDDICEENLRIREKREKNHILKYDENEITIVKELLGNRDKEKRMSEYRKIKYKEDLPNPKV